MRQIKITLIVLLVLLTLGQIATGIYLGFSDRTDPPTITCPPETLEVSVFDMESLLLTGVTASDPQDGDLTDHVIISGISKLISNDTVKVTYLVFDSDDNMASCVRLVRYNDYQRPVFEVIEPLVYSETESVNLLERLRATDVVDGDISSQIRVSTLSPTSNSELYNITIQVSNSLGDTSVLVLPVLLLDAEPLRPTITLTDYLIYMDEGSPFDPSLYLQELKVPLGQGNLSDVIIDNNVDTSKTGTYQVSYTYNSDGHVGTAILTVVVQ